MKRKVKFGVFADLHAATIPYGEERLTAFLDACRKENVDFIIELGDFCTPDYSDGKTDAIGNPIHPKRSKYIDLQKVVESYNNFEKPSYHVLGNHEFDTCGVKEILAYYGMEKPYYSFDKGGFHFVVLDNNYYLYEGKEYHYDTGNYYADADKKSIAYLPKEQLQWLKEDLALAKNPSILFAHNWLHELSSYFEKEDNKKNYAELMEIMKNAPNKVYMCMTGHTHREELFRTNEIWQYTVNSASGCWIGTTFPCRNRYTEEIDEVFPATQRTAVYKNSVYAIVEMDEDGALIKGTTSEFVGATPKELGVYTDKNAKWTGKRLPFYITPEIMDRYIIWLNK